MNKDAILQDVKEQIHLWTESIDLENINQIEMNITSCFRFIEQLRDLPICIRESVESELIEETEKISATTPEARIAAPAGAYTFVRKLRGGYVPELDAVVPEKIVRQMFLCDGDKLYLDSMREDGDRTYYTWSIAKRNDGEEVPDQTIPDRLQFNFCMVEKQAGRMIVQSQWNGEKKTALRHNDSMLSFVLKEDDVQEFHLEEGDLIDIASVESNLQFCKVIWKHSTEMTQTSTPMGKRKTSTKPITERQAPTNYSALEGAEILTHKHILVVGCESRKAEFKDAMEQCGAIFEWASGDEGKTRLAGMVRKSDAVVLLMDVIGHHARWTTGALAKDMNVPFHEVIGFGVTTVVRGAIEALSFPTQKQSA